MIISRLFNEFIVFSFGGWVYESIYCTARKGHWQNRGFLFGPICPIYGFGAMAVRLFSSALTKEVGADIPLWQLFLIFMIGSAVLEYVTSWGMEKLFHSRWWDYSNMPLNLNGRICLPASILFGVAGVLGWLYIVPHLPRFGQMENSLSIEGISLILTGMFGADLIVSVDSTKHLIAKLEATEEAFNAVAENSVMRIRSIPGKVSDAGSRVRGVTQSVRPRLGHIIVNPSEQLKEYAAKFTDRERKMLERIQSYHQISHRDDK